MVRRETGERHTDEVDEVVAGKSHRQAEGTHQDGELEDVDAAEVEELHHDGRHHEGDDEEHSDVVADIVAPLSRQVRTLAQALHEDEVGEGGEGDATEDGDGVAAVLLIIEGEYDTRDPHHDDAEEEGDGNGCEDTDDHLQCLVAIEQHAVVEAWVAPHLQGGEDEGTAEQLKHQGHGGGGRHTERVEHVQDDDVGHHDG